MRRKSGLWLAVAGIGLAATAFGPAAAAAAETSAVSLAGLKSGQVLDGFRAEALYLDATNRPMGARLRHAQTGFVLELLYFDSAPQAFIWVNTPTTTNKGEPHTQEHLVLGKGEQARALTNLCAMSLVEETAATFQWRTCYHFNTVAGEDVLFTMLERYLDALLHPNYQDEEVRREVCHFEASEDAESGQLQLDEKGTVYNEMVNYDSQPWRIWRFLNALLYGPEHPLAQESGGLPEGIRQLTPEEIRAFHERCYHLGNMGAVVALPRTGAGDANPGDRGGGAAGVRDLHGTLQRLGALLGRVEAAETAAIAAQDESTFPAPEPAPTGQIEIVQYPHENPSQPGPVILAWPPLLDLSAQDLLLSGLLMDAFATGPTSRLYPLLVDTETRVLDLGATDVWAGVDPWPGNPIYVGLEGVAPEHMTATDLRRFRQLVCRELQAVADLADRSSELAALNQRVQSRLLKQRREFSKFANSPPLFGARDTNDDWLVHLGVLDLVPGFRKSVVLTPELTRIQALVSSEKNIWCERLQAWKLLDSTPYAVAVMPSPTMIAEETAAREARCAAELERLKEQYHLADAQEALRRFQAEYDATTARLDAEARKTPLPPLIDQPPLVQDDLQHYHTLELPGGVPCLTASFEGMTSATVRLHMRLDGVPDDRLMYLALLPKLLTRVGLREGNRAVPYGDMEESLQREVLSFSSSFALNHTTGRCELAVVGSGNDARESRRAVQWMQRVLCYADWTPANLPRIRDVVDQALADLRQEPQGYPENWVGNVADAYRSQHRPILLAADSIFTRIHYALRLRWRLKAVPAGEDGEAALAFLDVLSAPAQAATRDDLTALLAAMASSQTGQAVPATVQAMWEAFQQLPAAAQATARDGAQDLRSVLPDIPDVTLAEDWAYLCRAMRADLAMPPEQALTELTALRDSLLVTGGARVSVTSSAGGYRALRPALAALVGELRPGPAPDKQLDGPAAVLARAQQHEGLAETPVFVGLVWPSMPEGTLMYDAPLVTYDDCAPDRLVAYLAANLRSSGAQSIGMKAWSLGLAYSCGLSASPIDGRIHLYADNVPDMPEFLRFLRRELLEAPHDPAQVESALGRTFWSREAMSYEARGAGMAADLADGDTPERVRRFRQGVLDLRERADLAEAVYARMAETCGLVAPGVGPHTGSAVGGQYIAIGSEESLSGYEAYLKSVEGPEARVWRVYPRDLWPAL